MPDSREFDRRLLAYWGITLSDEVFEGLDTLELKRLVDVANTYAARTLNKRTEDKRIKKNGGDYLYG